MAHDPTPFLKTEALARLIEFHDTIGSTNDRAKELAQEGAAHGTTVIASAQTAGRGQRGRTWHSPSGVGVYVTFLVRPQLGARFAPLMTLATSVALRETIQEVSGVELGIKWPNDLLDPTTLKKVAGILVEVTSAGQEVSHAVIGVGINLRGFERPSDIRDIATSLEELGATETAADRVVAQLANSLEIWLGRLPDRSDEMLERWLEYALARGEPVQLDLPDRVVSGRLVGVQSDGALQLEILGELKPFYNGQLRLR